MTSTQTTPTHDTTIRRAGQTLYLTIAKYDGRAVLAYDQHGRPWLRVGRGRWTEARLTIR